MNSLGLLPLRVRLGYSLLLHTAVCYPELAEQSVKVGVVDGVGRHRGTLKNVHWSSLEAFRLGGVERSGGGKKFVSYSTLLTSREGVSIFARRRQEAELANLT